MTPRRRACPERRGPVLFSGPRRPLIPWAVTLVLLSGCGFQQPPDQEGSDVGSASSGDLEDIETMLHASARSWNEGDLEGFLDDYWRSEELSFSGAAGVTRGWEDVRGRYLSSYWAPGEKRDSLRFEELEVSPLGEGHALALGRYVLYQPENAGQVTSSGHFTLILRRMEGTWKIIHDHSSSAAGGPESGGSGSPESGG